MRFTFAPESKPLDGYTIKRAIHRGGFGEVYYAVSDAGKEVALKLLRDSVDVELRGISQCLNLKHPNLVTIFDIRRDDEGDHWIVMEYVAGKSLERVLEEHPQGLPLEEVRRWLSGIVAGVSFLHERGLVHRDLKPGNIFQEDGIVKVGDVGLSKFITPSRRSQQTQSVGTVYYMAPEVSRGCYGREIDVYALGVMLYEMLTGRVPFEGETTGEILMKHLSEPPNLDPLPAWVRPVVARALRKDPHQRTPSVQRLLEEFEAALRTAGLASHTLGATLIDEAVAPAADSQLPRNETPHDADERPAGRRHQAGADDHRAGYTAHTAERPRRHAHADGWRRWTRHPGEAGEAQWGFALRVIIVVALLVAIFSPRTFAWALRNGIEAALVLAVVYGAVRLLQWAVACGPLAGPGRFGDRHRRPSAPESPTEAKAGANRPAGAAVDIPVRQGRRPAASPADLACLPSTPRRIPFRRRIADLCASMTSAVLCTGIMTAGLWLFVPGFFSTPMVTTDVGNMALFALLTLLGVWAVMIPAKFLEGRRVESNLRRLVFLVFGCGLGVLAFHLHGLLMAQLAVGPDRYLLAPYGIFHHVGPYPLVDAGGEPTRAAFLIFFGGLLSLRRWWWHADAFRKKPFRLSSVLVTVLLAYLLTAVWVFPQIWGMTLAAAISSIVQLASVWMPREHRSEFIEEHRRVG